MPRDDRPIAFLVSTTPCAGVIRSNLGSSAYSYYFVYEALKPALERLGTCRLVEAAPSRLASMAAQAEARGYRPVHLCLNPLQDAYFCPSVPTVAFPFWEYPEIPDRDFGVDTTQNWARVARRADLILTACTFTAEAFARSVAGVPIAVVPVPLDPAVLDTPDWEPSRRWTLDCRHEVWPSTPAPIVACPPAGPPGLAKRLYHRVYPRLDPKLVVRLDKARRLLAKARADSPKGLILKVAKHGYRRHLRPLLSELAIRRVTRVKEAGMRALGVSPREAIDPLLPSTPLTLSGLVYTSVFNLGDRRKNYVDLLSAYLTAHRDRPDATLVLKLATSPRREHAEMAALRATYRALGIGHRCRVVVITEFLDDAAMAELRRSTTYYVNTSHAEGACLPLQEALAAGRPGIAPTHTSMADYMDAQVGFALRSHPEPTFWPHDPSRKVRTTRQRLVWSDIRDAFEASYRLVEGDRAGYRTLADAARSRMAGYAGRGVAVEALRAALGLLDGDRVRLAS